MSTWRPRRSGSPAKLAALADEPEAAGLLALMLLHHARRASRTGPGGRLVRLTEQDRSLWDAELIAEGVTILQTALARDRLGEYQPQAAIAALHADARTASETDWVQIVEWYDEHTAVLAYLRERAGDLTHAGDLYAEAARAATSLAERDHLTREAARVLQQARALPPP